MKNFSQIYRVDKDLVLLISGRVLQVLIMLISIRGITYFLSPEEIGNYYLLQAVVAFYNLVALNPIGMYFSRHLILWQQQENLCRAISLLSLWIIVVCIVSWPATILLFKFMQYERYFDFSVFIFFLTCAILISAIHRNLLYSLNTLGHRKVFVILLCLTLVLGVSFSLLLNVIFTPSALLWLFGIILSEIILIPVLLRKFITGQPSKRKPLFSELAILNYKKIIAFSVPIAVTTFFMWGQNLSYRLILETYYGMELLALIAVGLSITSAIFNSVEAIITQYYYPIFLKKVTQSNKLGRTKAWNDMASKTAPVYLMTMLFIISEAQPILYILVDQKYHTIWLIVTLGSVYEFFRVMTNLINNAAISEYKTNLAIIPYLIGCCLTLVTLTFFELPNPEISVPLLLVFSYAVVFILYITRMNCEFKIALNINFILLSILLAPLIIKAILVVNSVITSSIVGFGVSALYYLFIISFYTWKTR